MNKIAGIVLAVLALLVAFFAVYWCVLRTSDTPQSDSEHTRVIVGNSDGSSSVFSEKSKSFEDNSNVFN